MRVAIMQPYFAPYIGYFQLINSVDRFIIYDDVNYINRGWINRNKILCNSSPTYITIPLVGASQNKKINEIEIVGNDWRIKMLRSIEHSYKKAPYYQQVISLISDIINYPSVSLSRFLVNSINRFIEYLEIGVELISTSEIFNNNHLKGEERILDICKQNKAKCYINPPGGKDLYENKTFENENIELKFLETCFLPYQQNTKTFFPGLSIIDLLMYNDKETLEKHLSSYKLNSKS